MECNVCLSMYLYTLPHLEQLYKISYLLCLLQLFFEFFNVP